MRVVRLAFQKNNQERINVYVDRGQGEEYGFSIDQDVFIRFQLKKGMEIDEDFLTEMLYEDTIKKVYAMSLKYLSYRMRSKREVIQYLQEKNAEANIIGPVIRKLEAENYINDCEFAKAFVRSRIRSANKGPLFIKQELIEKGIAAAIIEEALQEYTDEIQYENARKYADKLMQTNSKKSSLQQKNKIQTSLRAKGFATDIIGQVVNDLAPQDETTELEALHFHGKKAAAKFSRKFAGYEFEMRVKRYLLQRGFKAEHIHQFLQEEMRDNE